MKTFAMILTFAVAQPPSNLPPKTPPPSNLPARLCGFKDCDCGCHDGRLCTCADAKPPVIDQFSYSSAMGIAKTSGKPLVCFVSDKGGGKFRKVEGCVVCFADPDLFGTAEPVIVVSKPPFERGQWLPSNATDAEIRRAAGLEAAPGNRQGGIREAAGTSAPAAISPRPIPNPINPLPPDPFQPGPVWRGSPAGFQIRGGRSGGC